MKIPLKIFKRFKNPRFRKVSPQYQFLFNLFYSRFLNYRNPIYSRFIFKVVIIWCNTFRNRNYRNYVKILQKCMTALGNFDFKAFRASNEWNHVLKRCNRNVQSCSRVTKQMTNTQIPHEVFCAFKNPTFRKVAPYFDWFDSFGGLFIMFAYDHLTFHPTSRTFSSYWWKNHDNLSTCIKLKP